jgi:hypothetical protein
MASSRREEYFLRMAYFSAADWIPAFVGMTTIKYENLPRIGINIAAPEIGIKLIAPYKKIKKCVIRLTRREGAATPLTTKVRIPSCKMILRGR